MLAPLSWYNYKNITINNPKIINKVKNNYLRYYDCLKGKLICNCTNIIKYFFTFSEFVYSERLGNNMATSIAAENSTSADIRQSISRQISCLGDGSRSAKRRALEFIRKNTINKKQSIDTDVLEEIFCSDLRKPLLRCFSDPVDKCRELSIELVNEFIDILSTPGNLLPYLIPCAVQRLGQKEITEGAEEIRLLLVETIFKVIEKWGEDLGLYVNDLVNIFQQTLVDPFPDVRKQSCQCVCKVARKIPQHFHLQSEALINPLLKSSSHQHSKVRADCIYTIGDVLQFGNPKPMEKVSIHDKSVLESKTHQCMQLLSTGAPNVYHTV